MKKFDAEDVRRRHREYRKLTNHTLNVYQATILIWAMLMETIVICLVVQQIRGIVIILSTSALFYIAVLFGVAQIESAHDQAIVRRLIDEDSEFNDDTQDDNPNKNDQNNKGDEK